MNFKKHILLCSVFFSLFSSVSFSMKKDIIDVAIFLERYSKKSGESQELGGFKELGFTKAVTSTLIQALKQKVDVVIASAPLACVLKSILKDKKDKVLLKSFEDENLLIYRTKDSEFAVFVYKKHDGTFKLSDYDLNDNLVRIDKKKFGEEFKTVRLGNIKMDSLKAVFVDKPNNKKKILYLEGHGIAGIVAQLEIWEYSFYVPWGCVSLY